MHGRDLKASWPWLEFAAGLPSSHVAVPGNGPWGQLATGRYLLTGATLVNTGTAAATVVIRDGQDANGDVIASLVVPAGGGLPWQGPAAGILAEVGLWAASPGAAVSGAIYVVPLWHYDKTPPGR